jgi:tetratricopeptide (TPR) repeat protein
MRFWSVVVFLSTILVWYRAYFTSHALQNFGAIEFVQTLMPLEDEAIIREMMQAETWLRLAVAYCSKNHRAWRQLGFIKLAQDQGDEAITIWRNAREMDKEFIAWGKQAFREGEDRKALDWYLDAVELAPASGYPWYYIGLVYEKEGRWMDAIDAFRQAQRGTDSQQFASSLDFHVGRYLQLGLTPPDLSTSLKLYETALVSDRFVEDWERIDTHYHRGDILRRQGKLEEAIQEFLYVVDQEPKHYRGNVWLGELTWQLYGDINGAEQFLMRAINSNPTLVWGYKRLANIYVEAGQLAKAAEMYQRVLEIDPEDQTALRFFSK